MLVLCVLGAYYIRMHTSLFASNEPHHIIPKALLIAAVFQLFLHLNDIYGFRNDALKGICNPVSSLAMGTAALGGIIWWSRSDGWPRGFRRQPYPEPIFLCLHTLRLYLAVRTPHTNLVLERHLPARPSGKFCGTPRIGDQGRRICR
jgi:hypothetical protein